MSVHAPTVPAWGCEAGCPEQYPCATRRKQLLAEFSGSRATLALAMASLLVRACADLPDATAGELYDRFLGWVRSPAERV